jgi:glycine/D-amino acid oxidase-like deaminating enzyme
MQSRFMRLYPQHVARVERQLPLYSKAIRFWKSFEQALGADFGLKVSGGLMVAESSEQLAFLARKAAREKELGLDVSILGRAELAKLAPYLGEAIVGAEYCGDEGKLNPLLCNAAIRDWLTRLGIPVARSVRVETVVRSGNRFELRTDAGNVNCERLILAAGWEVASLATGLGVTIPARAEPLHMNITDAAPPLIDHLVQHADRMITLKQLGSGQVVIGGGWPARLNERRHVDVELSSLLGNVTLAQHIVPALGLLRVIRSWGGVNTSVDGAGVLGSVPGVPRLFVAIPGDAGYTLGPLSARLVADLVLGRAPAEDISPFSPARFEATA